MIPTKIWSWNLLPKFYNNFAKMQYQITKVGVYTVIWGNDVTSLKKSSISMISLKKQWSRDINCWQRITVGN